mmetsp:Transcript_12932/g.11059  ORF Transcript_12932/g.11059 Transcript_12932/m.11059 type:complete len:122 (-) Transcript_12932:2319-2684(-)
MSIFWPDLDHLSLYIHYGKDRINKKDIHSYNINFEGEFTLKNVKDVPRYMTIEICDEKDHNQPRRIKSVDFDLKRIAVNSIQKIILKLNDDIPDGQYENYATSEIELSILIVGVEKPLHSQ